MWKLGHFDHHAYEGGPGEEHQQPVEISIFALFLRGARAGHSAVVLWF